MAAAAPEIPVLAQDQAFENLYRRYVKDVYHYALALLRNPADAEDVTQTTFMNAYRAYKRGEQPIKPQNWLIKIAHNVARTRYARASRRVKEVPLEDHVEQLAVPEDEKPDVHAVLEALGRLPLNQRAALVMRELEGRTYAEIADTLGVSVAAVETLIFRGRRSLRLKASAIRALAAVPVPTSLAQLFEAGGVVAGGGAIIGSGFLLKAAVAIVAGVVATGVGSGPGKQAQAENKVAVPGLGSGSEQSLRPAQGTTTAKATAAGLAGQTRASRVHGPVATAPASRFSEVESSHGAGVASSAPAAGPAPSTGRPADHSSPIPSAASAPTPPAAAAPKPVTDTVGSVTSAIPPAPPPPVDLPSVPSVEVPGLPALPTLP
jgi:RNA polymerase sigma factor (sigma-70 family)